MKLDTISLLLIPAYVLSATIGALSGKIAQFLGSKQSIIVAMAGITISVLLGGFFVQSSVVVFVISTILFSSSFALKYAPMIDSCVSTIANEHSGTAVGFYNLVLNVAASIGIAYTTAMMDSPSMKNSFLGYIHLAMHPYIAISY